VSDSDQIQQYRLMQKHFYGINKSEYTYPTDGIPNSLTMDSQMVYQIAEKNQAYLKSKCGSSDLESLGLKIPRSFVEKLLW